MNQFFTHWKWFVFSLGSLLGAGYIYLHTTQPTYSVQAAILIRNDQKNDTGEREQHELSLSAPSQVIENEIKVLQSFQLMKRVVDKLALTTRYYEKTALGKREIYRTSPVEVLVEQPTDDLYATLLEIERLDAQTVRLNNKTYPLNQRVTTPFGQLRLMDRHLPNSQVVYARVAPLHEAVQRHLKSLRVTPSSKASSVIDLALEETVLRKGEDLLKQLITEYNLITIEDKNQSVATTLGFLKKRLALVAGEVSTVERSMETYKSVHGITDISADARVLLEQVQKNDVELDQTSLRLNALTEAEAYMQANRDQRSAVPATLGLGDPTLIALFNRLTDLELQRDNLTQTTSEANPFLRSLDSQIGAARRTIDAAIASHRKNLTSTQQQLRKTNDRYEAQIRAIPGQERTLMDISRQQSVKNNLYTYLLQKQEEIALTYAAAASGIRLVDPPFGSAIPTRPNKQLIWLLFGSLGLLLPTLVITLRNTLYERVSKRADLDDALSVPVLGELAETKRKHPTIINQVDRSITAEQIRALRTKLQMLPRLNGSTVLLVTSGISGEGKSFLSLNLSASFALVNQPTVLLEMDLRKPDLHAQLGIPNTLGLSDYLNGDAELDEILLSVNDTPNQYLITCGTGLPNPAELLMSGRLEHLFRQLRERFAYIVVDAPPIGLVTDAAIIAPHTDLTLYLIRYHVTPKHSLREVDALFRENRLPHMGLVLNSASQPRAYSQQYYKRSRPKLS